MGWTRLDAAGRGTDAEKRDDFSDMRTRQIFVQYVRPLEAIIWPGHKAAGCDGIVAKHLKFAHPVVFVSTTKLFDLLISIKYVPTFFYIYFPNEMKHHKLKITTTPV